VLFCGFRYNWVSGETGGEERFALDGGRCWPTCTYTAREVRGEYDYTEYEIIRQRYEDEQEAMYRSYVPHEPRGVEDHA
jgi:hypothetical protein